MSQSRTNRLKSFKMSSGGGTNGTGNESCTIIGTRGAAAAKITAEIILNTTQMQGLST